MNMKRRDEISACIKSANSLSAIIDRLKSEEEDYRDAIPENLQGSERYDNADSACDALQDALDSLDEVIEHLESAKE